MQVGRQQRLGSCSKVWGAKVLQGMLAPVGCSRLSHTLIARGWIGHTDGFALGPCRTLARHLEHCGTEAPCHEPAAATTTATLLLCL